MNESKFPDLRALTDYATSKRVLLGWYENNVRRRKTPPPLSRRAARPGDYFAVLAAGLPPRDCAAWVCTFGGVV